MKEFLVTPIWKIKAIITPNLSFEKIAKTKKSTLHRIEFQLSSDALN